MAQSWFMRSLPADYEMTIDSCVHKLFLKRMESQAIQQSAVSWPFASYPGSRQTLS